MFKKATAVRENVKLKIGISGPSGAGKTYSALQMAYGITGDWKKIAVADTENESAKFYADLGPWEHIPFDPGTTPNGYHPDNWVKLIQFAESFPSVEVLILDSISHEWEGKGGCLDLVDQMGSRGNSFTAWKSVTPMHNRFVDAIRLSKLHVIATMRSKQDYVIEQNDKGKSVPKKVGLKSIQREGLDYDFGIVFDVAINHFASSSKDRTGVFMPKGEFRITPETGKELIGWATSGQEPAPREDVIPETYQAEKAQKGRLMTLAKAQGITEVEALKALSEACKGLVEMVHLEAAISEWKESQGK